MYKLVLCPHLKALIFGYLEPESLGRGSSFSLATLLPKLVFLWKMASVRFDLLLSVCTFEFKGLVDLHMTFGKELTGKKIVRTIND